MSDSEILDPLASVDIYELPMGSSIETDTTYFKVFSPKATSIEVFIFADYQSDCYKNVQLQKHEDGNWVCAINENLVGKLYAFKIGPPADSSDFFMETPFLIADPWSKQVTSINNYLQLPKTKIVGESDFDWEDDTFVSPEDPRDLIIYEAHIKDMVAHPSARTYVNGVYNDFREAKIGGISHLKRLGVNAVEFLPLQKFGYFEPHFNQETPEGVKNTWNPYSRNYWGYMTSFFLAPETIYASDGSLEQGALVGASDAAEKELKSLVKALHKEGISVIMDVVYNHASHYDLNPLKFLAKDHYFKLDEIGNFINDSWTGNDINTSAEYSRKLIVDSILHWIKEYHIDGFRFDLAGIIDWETIELIKKEAQKINPNVVLIAEPWGGDYKPTGFSERGWASWNDRIRNGFKGYDPIIDKGFIFGSWSNGSTRFGLENFIRGTLQGSDHGLFNSSKHTVNYIESHDGYTLGDFIRIGLNPQKATDTNAFKANSVKLNKQELAIAKFAALSLFVSQGITMIHAGQEWARSKVITDKSGLDSKKGMLDHDSYNKDNETNWLNFDNLVQNKSLFNYYKGLIQLRLNSPGLRKAKPQEIQFKVYTDPLHITFSILSELIEEPYEYFISLNGNLKNKNAIVLPDGFWEVVVDSEKASKYTNLSVEKTYILPPISGVVLRRLRVMQS